MYLRRAKNSDMETLFYWANDSECRSNAFCTKEINFEDHKSWFEEKINSINTEIFIACIDNEDVGQIRLDYCEEGAIIDYSIKKELRGVGLGAKMLKLLEDEVKEHKKSETLIGKVKFENISSQRSFEKQGYEKQECKNYIKYYKTV